MNNLSTEGVIALIVVIQIMARTIEHLISRRNGNGAGIDNMHRELSQHYKIVDILNKITVTQERMLDILRTCEHFKNHK